MPWGNRRAVAFAARMEKPPTRNVGATFPLMTKQELHRLVDALPEESLPAVAELLRRARDPVVAKLDAAPYDDEKLTKEDRHEVREAQGEPGVPWPEAEAELDAG